MNQALRIQEFFGCSGDQAREVFDVMVRGVGEKEIDDLAPADFASLVCRTANALASINDESIDLPNRADCLMHTLETISRSSDATREILGVEAESLSTELSNHPGMPVVIVRHSIAMVPRIEGGKVRYQPMPLLDLDTIEWDRLERALIPIVAAWMSGNDLDWQLKDILRGAILSTTNATSYEANAVVNDLRGLITRPAPGDLASFADLCVELLGRVREKYGDRPNSHRSEIPAEMTRTQFPFEGGL